jgi:hypothetical protein
MEIGFVAYFISVLSLAVSIYAVYLISDFKNNISKSKNIKQYKPPTKVSRKTGHWD